MKNALIGVALILFVAASVGQSAKWKSYVNSNLGFELTYPAHYQAKDFPDAASYAASGLKPLFYAADAEHTDRGQEASIEIVLDSRAFSVEALRSYSPTGMEDITPAPIRVGEYTFYYYGAGGGGVSYPDAYFYNLHGHILRIMFDGPYPPDDKSPTAETKEIERKILASFRLLRVGHPAHR
jgi:hypothetical protein